jgi:hypothetical protein
MKRLILFGTTHAEIGKCNINEFYNALFEIKPDIIFEEMPIKIFDGIYNDYKYYDTIEVGGIRKYLKNNQVRHIPVDGIIPGNNMNEKINNYQNEIFNLFEEENDKNREIINLGKYINKMYKEDRFLWLNTKYHDELIGKKYKLIENYLMKHENSLLKKYKEYYKYHFEIREEIILDNIYNAHEEYNNGLLWIGCDHRPTIIKKVNQFEIGKKAKIIWKYYYKEKNI